MVFFNLSVSWFSGKWKTKHPWMSKCLVTSHTNDISKTEWMELHGHMPGAKHVAYRWSYQKGLYCSLRSVFCHSRSVCTCPGETPKQERKRLYWTLGYQMPMATLTTLASSQNALGELASFSPPLTNTCVKVLVEATANIHLATGHCLPPEPNTTLEMPTLMSWAYI